MLKWAVGQRRSDCAPPPRKTRRCSVGKENSNVSHHNIEWDGSRETLFTRLEPTALRDVSNYHRLGETPPRTPERRTSLKRPRKSEERLLEWRDDSPERKKQACVSPLITAPVLTGSKLKLDPVRNLLQIEFSPIVYVDESPSPVELDHKDIPLRQEQKEIILRTPKVDTVREDINKRLSEVSPLANKFHFLKLGGFLEPLEPPSTLKRQRVIRRRRNDRHPITALTLPDGVPSPFESPAVMARLQPSFLTLPSGIPSPASPGVHPLSDTSATSSTKIFDEDDGVSSLGSAEQSPLPIVEGKSRSRRCLTFTSPVRKKPHRTPSTRQQGELELNMQYSTGVLTIHVIRGKNLQPPSEGTSCNAYIKVSLVPGQERTIHRTCVRRDSCNPRFETKFLLELTDEDLTKRVLVSAWHRDRGNRKSEFLGCMSFAVKHVIKKDISGSFRLLSQSCGRIKNVPSMTNSENVWHQQADVMANQSESSVEELLSVDESEVGPQQDNPGVREKRKSRALKKDIERVHEDQIFLRHLELDPPEDENTKSGRTPFTTTRILNRQPGCSFGFSIAWTHPPRIERVESSLPADQAGLRPGDYVIFVGKTNVVTLQEEEILQLIKSFGDRVVLEVYRKATTNGARTSMAIINQPRSSTACSGATTATASIDRRRLHLPQVTFTTEQGYEPQEETRKKSVYQLLGKEQQYALCMQFGIARFLVPLSERRDVMSQTEHGVLFQNAQELLRHTEDILELYVQDETLGQSLGRIYYKKMNALNNAYRRYCIGLKKADCILVEKTRNPNFMKIITEPAIPKRRPDLTTFIHKPLEHFREVLKLLQTALNTTKIKDEDHIALSKVVHEMQTTYRDITVESGLMEPEGEGRPLLSLQDLESRLVFTRCKPFILSSPGRQWIFGGDLSRVEGRSVRPFWALLFSDLLLFAKVSRDRVIFVTEDPLPLNTISQALFSIRKKATEFRLLISNSPAGAESPAVGGCADLQLTRTPRKGPRRRTVALRAPTPELKAVWQNLIQRQIIYVNTARGGTPASSPMDSPDPLTADSMESITLKRQVEPKPVTVNELIEHRCRQLGKSGMSKGSALHLSLWMRGQLGEGSPEELSEPEIWSPERMRKRVQELGVPSRGRSLSRCEEIDLSDHSTSDSQMTVRSFSGNSEKLMAVCRKCHKTCLLNNNNNNTNLNNNDVTKRIDINANCPKTEGFCDDWGESSSAALSPSDPFLPVPHISVQPATPLNNNFPWTSIELNSTSFDCDGEGAESDGEVPYRSLSPTGLKRYGTVSSLEKLDGEESDQGEETDDLPQDQLNQYETVGQSIKGWTVRAGTYVVEKMAFLERIGEDSHGVSFIERYLKTNPSSKHSEELIATSTSLAGEDEYETSGATSGEEIWGTPTSGDSGVTSPNNEDNVQHYDGTVGTAFDDAREQLMMDKLLSGVSMMGSLVPLCPVSRGFPQRRRLDPLPEDEEESTESSASSEEATKSYSTDQGNKSDSCAAKAKSATSTPHHRFFNRLKLRRSHSADSKPSRPSKIMEFLRGSKSEEHTSSSRSRLSRLFSRDLPDDVPTTLPPEY
ncbi:unnamed protein product, partial [Nezara viridula]